MGRKNRQIFQICQLILNFRKKINCPNIILKNYIHNYLIVKKICSIFGTTRTRIFLNMKSSDNRLIRLKDVVMFETKPSLLKLNAPYIFIQVEIVFNILFLSKKYMYIYFFQIQWMCWKKFWTVKKSTTIDIRNEQKIGILVQR